MIQYNLPLGLLLYFLDVDGMHFWDFPQAWGNFHWFNTKQFLSSIKNLWQMSIYLLEAMVQSYMVNGPVLLQQCIFCQLYVCALQEPVEVIVVKLRTCKGNDNDFGSLWLFSMAKDWTWGSALLAVLSTDPYVWSHCSGLGLSLLFWADVCSVRYRKLPFECSALKTLLNWELQWILWGKSSNSVVFAEYPPPTLIYLF